MKLLVLGGTEFVGRAVVESALTRGWDVTTLNRGRHPALPGVRALIGDRAAPDGLAALDTPLEWDAAVDTWSSAPSAVRDSAAVLAEWVGSCAYVSSRSVYRYPTAAGADEDHPVVDGSPDDDDADDYARAKRGGELATLAAFGERALIARPGLILGPHENIGRLPWWLDRISRGGRVLAPGPPDLGVQYIDARDLADWVLDALADPSGPRGPVNVVSPPEHATMRRLLEACIAATGSDAELVWATPEQIEAAGIAPWTELPAWLPPGEPHESLHEGDVGRALAAGLRCRPVDDTVADTWSWMRALGGPVPQRPDRPAPGLASDREQSLLATLA